MNIGNCTFPWANDEILIFGTVEACTLPFPVYLALLSALTLNRFKIALVHILSWRKRELMLKKRNAGKGRHRNQLPIVPVLSSVVALSQALFLVLTATNVISSRDGSTSFLFSFIFFVIMLIAQLHAFKLVRLGKKLVPLLAHHGSSSHDNERANAASALANFDGIQSVLIWVWWFAAATMAITPFLVYYLAPFPNADAFRALLIANVVMNASNIFIQIHQMTRVIYVVMEQYRETALIVSPESNPIKQYAVVVNRLRRLRILFGFQCILYCSILIADAITLNFFWWMYVFNVALEQLYLEAFAGTMGKKEPSRESAKDTAEINTQQIQPKEADVS